MSGIVPELRCALCQKAIDPMGDFFRASGDFLPPRDPLTKYCNAPMHWGCYVEWSERPRFARHFVDAWVKANRKNPFWWSVHRDEQVYISVNPQKPIEEAAVRLYAVGDDIRVPLPRWSEWLGDLDSVTPGLDELERVEIRKILPMLRERYPTDHALVDAIDPDEKRPRRRGARRSSTASEG